MAERFERFERFTSSPQSGDSGLGLAIVRAVAKAHGGDVGIVEDPAQRCDVWISSAAKPPVTTGPSRGTTPGNAFKLGTCHPAITDARFPEA